MPAVAGTYEGPSFCPNATLGGPNRHFPDGRIVSRKVGTGATVINDLDSLALANGLKPLGARNAFVVIAGQINATWFPIPVGSGWWVTKNYISGDVSTWNRGLTLRTNASVGKVNIDIPSGFALPNGDRLEMAETCHYVRR